MVSLLASALSKEKATFNKFPTHLAMQPDVALPSVLTTHYHIPQELHCKLYYIRFIAPIIPLT